MKLIFWYRDLDDDDNDNDDYDDRGPNSTVVCQAYGLFYVVLHALELVTYHDAENDGDIDDANNDYDENDNDEEDNRPKPAVCLAGVRLFEVVLGALPGLLHIVGALGTLCGVLAAAQFASVHVAVGLGFLQAFPCPPAQNTVVGLQVVSGGGMEEVN